MTQAPGSAQLAAQVRRRVIECSRAANVGHIGSSLSIADLIAVLFAEDGLRLDGHDRDRFVLSKGHAALALYCALEARDRLPEDAMAAFCSDGTTLGVHPEAELEGIDFSTGSLGQGLPVAVGAALAARMQGSSRRVVALLSDAELNEGSVWEAVMFAGHHRLDGLTAVLDLNAQQALGFTAEVIDLGAVEDKLQAFGWDAQVVDGHDHEALRAALTRTAERGGRPHAICARTTFGKGVSFMESKIEWHYLPLSDVQYDDAMREIAPAQVTA